MTEPDATTAVHLPLPAFCRAAFTFAWVFAFPGRQSAAEHLLVYWVAPVAAGAFGGWAFRGRQLFDAERRQQEKQQQAEQQRAKAD